MWDDFMGDRHDAFARPIDGLDETYMTEKQKTELYKEATDELRLRLKVLQEQKKSNDPWVLRTFDDLVFNRDLITKFRIAVDNFVNSYGIRVEETSTGYDVYVLKDGADCTTTHLDSDKMKSLTSQQVTSQMKIIQSFGSQTW